VRSPQLVGKDRARVIRKDKKIRREEGILVLAFTLVKKGVGINGEDTGCRTILKGMRKERRVPKARLVLLSCLDLYLLHYRRGEGGNSSGNAGEGKPEGPSPKSVRKKRMDIKFRSVRHPAFLGSRTKGGTGMPRRAK